MAASLLHALRVTPSRFRMFCRRVSGVSGFPEAAARRGLFKEVFPAQDGPQRLTELLESGPQTIYCGFDPTADSLHIGNLLAVLGLIHFHRAGHNIVAVIGGATARLGDPSGRGTEREAMDPDQIAVNSRGIRLCLDRVFGNCAALLPGARTGGTVTVLDNDQWYRQRRVSEFLGSVGRQFRVGTMMSRHSVRSRLGSPEGMNLAEFVYQMFQAYDFYHLHQEYQCTVQLGGTDQLGNIMSGHDLIHRMTGRDVFGITLPLITNTAGDKLGKSGQCDLA
ncbi:hypothetical protein GDO86_005001 [Hymenochirus boettgeri]|uniref:Tyrosine--tRNA ligase n=1 Tax=Hymenochirus boettgeri TaxID=247094 RepID=A0A8T2J891_9PIPI|nr:hypothetical protein GDO86_005001 [Hymenochirus boettgeri]